MWGHGKRSSTVEQKQAELKTDAVLSRVTTLVDRLYENLDDLSEVLDELHEDTPQHKDKA